MTKGNLIEKMRILFMLTVFIVLVTAFSSLDEIRYFTSPSIKGDIETVNKYQINFNDTIPNDTLYQNISKEGYPLSYFRKITTGICFDNKCRILDIVLFWDITGRYLGFELPAGEFLSKTDHEPFGLHEYEKLHGILADEQSPIADFPANQIIIKPQTASIDLDGVTGATAPAILDHVVPGAVYTTYQLWHFAYGQTKEEVEKLTIETLSADLILKILDSQKEVDKVWALDHINGYVSLNADLKEALLRFISDDNYSVAERAIAAISSSELKDTAFQEAILERFDTENHSLKQQLIGKLGEADRLSANVVKKLTDNIDSLSIEMLGRVIDLFRNQNITDSIVLKRVSPLLNHENLFIQRKVYGFLKSAEKRDSYVDDVIEEYEATNKSLVFDGTP